MYKILIIIFAILTSNIALAQNNANLIVKTTKGEIFDLQKNKNKDVVIIFFVSWCKHCHHKMIELENLYNQKQLEVLAINIDELDDEKDFLKFSEKFSFKKAKFSEIIASDFAKPNSLPMVYYINKQGEISENKDEKKMSIKKLLH